MACPWNNREYFWKPRTKNGETPNDVIRHLFSVKILLGLIRNGERFHSEQIGRSNTDPASSEQMNTFQKLYFHPLKPSLKWYKRACA